MTFGAYLRDVREDQYLTLDALAERTKIKRNLLAELEADSLASWPRYLVYRYGYVRSIAEALHLDPDELLDRFDDAFPDYTPVAFDGGMKAPQARRRKKPVATEPALGRAAMFAVGVGMVAGVALGLFGRQMPVVDQRLENGRPRDTGQDIILAPGTLQAGPIDETPMNLGDDPVVDAVAAGYTEGELVVASNPPRAYVTVNGIGRGQTPARVRYLPLGSYTIRVIQPGFPARESRVSLTPDRPVRTVNVALRQARVRQAAASRRVAASRVATTRRTAAAPSKTTAAKRTARTRTLAKRPRR